MEHNEFSVLHQLSGDCVELVLELNSHGTKEIGVHYLLNTKDLIQGHQ